MKNVTEHMDRNMEILIILSSNASALFEQQILCTTGANKQPTPLTHCSLLLPPSYSIILSLWYIVLMIILFV